MAITLLNGFVAVRNPETSKGLIKGTVVMVASGVTVVSQGDKVLYSPSSHETMDREGTELILIPAVEIIAKL